MKTIGIHISLLIAIPLAMAADISPSRRDLTPMLRTLVDQYKLPGVVGAIVHGDQVVALGSAGIRKVGGVAPFVATNTIHLGSDTKAMTALLIGQLIDKKQIQFDSTMREVFPDLAAKMDPAMAKVTVRDLLNHDAGLAANLDWDTFDVKDLPAQRRKAVEKALSSPPVTLIGSFSYSNTGYVVLGAIVEAKTGKSWEQVMQQNIFRPLHMASAGFGPPGTPGKLDQPWGHILEKEKLTPVQVDNPPVMGPAGRGHCSISDWAKFISEILKAAQGHSTFISAETFKELITPLAGQEYAGGWGIVQRPWADGLTLTHNGSNTTWYCSAWLAPKKNIAFLIGINFGGDAAKKAADEGVTNMIHSDSSAGHPSNTLTKPHQ